MSARNFYLILFAWVTFLAHGADFDQKLYDQKARVYPPEESMALMELQDGYSVELVASEPMVEEPAAMAWDGDGKLYVAELNTYMQDIDGKNEHAPVCRVVLLEDTDDDGKMDKRSVFVDKLVLPRMIQPLGDRVIIRETNTFDLHSYRDTDGDGVADEKVLVYEGGPRGGNLEHQPSGLVWNIDNWMYVTYTNRRYRWEGDRIVSEQLPNGSGQWGVTHDDVGRNFFCTAGGENPAQAFQQPLVYGSFSLPGEKEPGFHEVFPLVQIPDVQGGQGRYRKDQLTLNNFTGCAGQHIFRGDRLPSDFYGDYIIPEPVGRLIRRAKVVHENGKVILKNATPGTEFLRSRDANFRPVHAATGPDGCLYICDMYRGIIQEGAWVRPGSYLRGVVEQYGLDKNIGRGRIYRIVHQSTKRAPKPNLLKETSKQLAQHLSHPNGWWRDEAQKLIVVRGDKSVVPDLERMTREEKSPLGRLHALWALDGLGASDIPLLVEKLNDSDDRVRAAAIRILEPAIGSGNLEVLEHLSKLAKDTNPDIAIQLVLSLAHTGASEGSPIIEQISEQFATNPNVTAVIHHMQTRQEDAKRRRAYSELLAQGETNYKAICTACHGEDGRGTPVQGIANMTLGAPLAGSSRLVGKKDIPIKIVLKGMMGKLDGKIYPGPMLPLESYDDKWIASVLTYVRTQWGNRAPSVSPEDVAAVRATILDKKTMWQADEIMKITPIPSKQMQSWVLSASHNQQKSRQAIDGNPSSRWDTGITQRPGMWFAFDMGEAKEITSIVLDCQASAFDYPRQYSVEISDDGKTWSDPIVSGQSDNPMLDMMLPGIKTRHVRISQHGFAEGKFWSIHKLEVYTK